MDVEDFVDELLRSLTDSGLFEGVTLQAEGPVASGYAYVRGDEQCFLRFYYNEVSGTIAFALIKQQHRAWGIDFDNRRQWHVHPVENPEKHTSIDPLSVTEVVKRLQDVLLDLCV
jgi:hypothetical protein